MKRTELKRYQRHTLKRNQPLPDFPGGPVAKNPPAVQRTWVWSLVQEDPTRHSASKSKCYNHWAQALVRAPQEKPPQGGLRTTTRERPKGGNKHPVRPVKNERRKPASPQASTGKGREQGYIPATLVVFPPCLEPSKITALCPFSVCATYEKRQSPRSLLVPTL